MDTPGASKFQAQGMRLRFERRFIVPSSAKAISEKAVDYWSRRGVTFTEVEEARLSGRRGSVWGNLTSFDPSDLLAEVTISFDEAGGVRCVLIVDRILQVVTEWNRAWWE